jgi:hypothetical protein
VTWFIWRQHRSQAVIAAAGLAAFAVLVLITGLQMASQFHADVAACTATHTCRWPAGDLTLGNPIVGFLVEATLVVPAVLGMFWGAPLVSREIETGTSQFAWMQSVTRRRWLAVSTGWMLLAAAVWGGAVSALVTWWSGPKNAAFLNGFNPGNFDVQGIVPVAYAVFAMALGIAAGALVRRSLPALAITLGGFFALRLTVMGWLRPHYLHAVTAKFAMTAAPLPPGAAWQLSQGTLKPGGAALAPGVAGPIPVAGGNVPANLVPAGCQAIEHRGGNAGATYNAVLSCLNTHGFRQFVTYQPAGRYWAFQGIETGIFLAVAAALLVVTAVAVLRRDA